MHNSLLVTKAQQNLEAYKSINFHEAVNCDTILSQVQKHNYKNNQKVKEKTQLWVDFTLESKERKRIHYHPRAPAHNVDINKFLLAKNISFYCPITIKNIES